MTKAYNPSKYSASDLVQCFIDTILDQVEISQKKDSKFIAKKDRHIEIDSYNYKQFEEEYSVKYSIEERNSPEGSRIKCLIIEIIKIHLSTI